MWAPCSSGTTPPVPAWSAACVAEDLADAAVTRDSIDDVVLVISELVGNAVTHSVASDLDIAWQIDGQSVVVRVHDASPALPRMHG